jgi:hypothetical protein
MFLEKGIIMVPKAHSVGSHRRGVAKLQGKNKKTHKGDAIHKLCMRITKGNE